MLRLQIEAERADLEAETVALKTDVVVEMGIPLSQLGGADADLAQAAMPDDEAAEVAAELAAGPAPPRRPPMPAPPAAPRRPPRPSRAGDAPATRRRRRARLTPVRAPARILGACPTACRIPAPRTCASRRSASATAASRPAWRKPVDGPDDWWLAVLWVTDADGVVSFRDVGARRGPAPGAPARSAWDPSFAGVAVRARSARRTAGSRSA